jgi:hypothetical protein
MSISPNNFEFVYDGFDFSVFATCGENEVVLSAETSLPNIGVSLSWSGRTFTVSGTFYKVFAESTWSYIPTGSTSTTSVTTNNIGTITEVPSTISTLISGTHDPRIEIPITYTVSTKKTITIDVPEIPSTGEDDPGTPGYSYDEYEYHTHVIDHKVCNHWDVFKNQLTNVLARGTL